MLIPLPPLPPPARGSPRDLRVSDETTTTMRLGWAPAPGNVAQYRVSFRPLAGGPRKEVSVKGQNTALLLKNLRPGTEYELSVRARYPTGLGDPLEGSGTTLQGRPGLGLRLDQGAEGG